MRPAIVVVALLAACGYPALDSGKADGGLTDGGVKDGGPDDASPDGPPTDGAVTHCDAPASYGTATATSQTADYWIGSSSSPDELDYKGRISGTTADTLFVEFLSDDPSFGGAGIVGPTTFPISGIELNFQTCGGCVVLAAKCSGCSPYSGAGTATYYMATGGTLQLDSLSSSRTKGRLVNVTFEHVTIDNTGTNPTYRSTPVHDGCVSKISSLSFDAPLTFH